MNNITIRMIECGIFSSAYKELVLQEILHHVCYDVILSYSDMVNKCNEMNLTEWTITLASDTKKYVGDIDTFITSIIKDVPGIHIIKEGDE